MRSPAAFAAHAENVGRDCNLMLLSRRVPVPIAAAAPGRDDKLAPTKAVDDDRRRERGGRLRVAETKSAAHQPDLGRARHHLVVTCSTH
jgi:hypothetical protein